MKLQPRLLINWQSDVVTIPSRFICAARNGTIGRSLSRVMGKISPRKSSAFLFVFKVKFSWRLNRALNARRFSVKDCDIHRASFSFASSPASSAFHLNLIKCVAPESPPVISCRMVNFTSEPVFSFLFCLARKKIEQNWSRIKWVAKRFDYFWHNLSRPAPNEILWAIGTNANTFSMSVINGWRFHLG